MNKIETYKAISSIGEGYIKLNENDDNKNAFKDKCIKFNLRDVALTYVKLHNTLKNIMSEMRHALYRIDTKDRALQLFKDKTDDYLELMANYIDSIAAYNQTLLKILSN